MECDMKPTVFAPYVVLMVLGACKSYTAPSYTTPPIPHTSYSAQGDSATIAAKLDEFRTALGGVLNAPNSPPAATGRREINWDGVPPALTNVDNFPADFFNANSKRGAVFVTSGTGLRIDSTAFASVKAELADQFKAFSPKKLFEAVGSTRLEVDFKVVGDAATGLVSGFGVVFSDVDRVNSTTVTFFDASGAQLAQLAAPAHSGAHEFAFVGAVFESALVAKVQIKSGDAAVTDNSADVSAGGATDLVVMDDFVYGEPQPVQ
jgi:hypothetical protein